jgi:hypothetical protein
MHDFCYSHLRDSGAHVTVITYAMIWLFVLGLEELVFYAVDKGLV